MTTIDVTQVANQVSSVDEVVMKLLPEISLILGFIPGAQIAVPFMPLVGAGLTALDEAAKAVAAGNPGMAFQDIMNVVVNHLTPGKPNSPILSGH
jgi:hypothetical protein